MKKNYKIHFDPPDISSERIQQYQDFDALLAKMQPKEQPQAKVVSFRRWTWLAGAVAAALVGVLFWWNQEATVSDTVYFEQQQAYFSEQAFVEPPLPNIQPTFASYTVNANEGGRYTYNEGSTVTVPTAAFQDETGAVVEGDVQLYYREMHDPVDFFLSGIPLTYDSAGISYVLESAGMIEVYAEQNGKRILMRPGKSLDIELVTELDIASLEVPENYNIYRLNPEARNWEYQSPNRMNVLTTNEENTVDPNAPFIARRNELMIKKQQVLAQMEAELEPLEKPTAPYQRNADLPSLELDFLDSFKGSAEAKAIRDRYDGAVWQLVYSQPELTKEAIEEEWETVEMEQSDEENRYVFVLKKGDRKQRLAVSPVLPDAQYAKALQTYEEELLRYEQEQALRTEELAAAKAEIEADFQDRLAVLSAQMNEGQQFTNTSPSQKRKIVNYFKANSFGIWNCDRPLPPDPRQASVVLRDETGKVFNNQRAFLMDYNRNSVQQILIGEPTVLRFDASSQHLLWLVLDENRIAVMRPEQFNELKNQKKSQEVILDLIEQSMQTEADVRRVIQL